MNSKERVFAVLDGQIPDRIPTAFWMHFPPECYYGQEAVEAHLEYFRRSKTDICKVMTEHTYPCQGNIQCASDWGQVKRYHRSAPFIALQADIVKAVVQQCGEFATAATIHGVVASASHTLLGIPRYDSIGRYAQLYHLRTAPQMVFDAYQRIAETLCVMVQEFVSAGADGIYYAALGGESDGFTDEEHARYIAPLDKMVINAAYEAGAKYVVLHMCKPRVNLRRFLDYPCDVVNWGIRESGVSLREGKTLFPGKVVLGGLDNCVGPLTDGDEGALESAVARVIDEAGPKQLILGSDCTLPGAIPYERIAQVADLCGRHGFRSTTNANNACR